MSAKLSEGTSPVLDMPMDLDTKLTIPPQVMSRPVGDETVLLDLDSGMYFGLDGVGQRIWESMGEGQTLGETAAVIVAEYQVNEAQAQADVIEFVRDLLERGLLVE
jgi:hypothetical protein